MTAEVARLSSGHAALDTVLGGGIPRDAITLLVGDPGSGKTILAQQYVFHNATPQRPVLYLTTVSEPFDKIVRYGQSLSFFDPAVVGSAVLYFELGGVVHAEGLRGVLTTVGDLIKQHRPGMVVIDSFKALASFADDQREFRWFLHELAGRLSVLAASALWVGEYSPEEITQAAEFAIADAIISLNMLRTAKREFRTLHVLKLRGSDFRSGHHVYRIGSDGLRVFPRLADPHVQDGYELPTDRVTTGIPALDDALGDGYWPGSATLVAGPSGVGKTILGMHFVFEGVSRGEPGIIASLQENPVQLARLVSGLGWSLDADGVHVLSRSPVAIYIDEWVYELLELIEETGAKRVVIDSLGDLALAAGDELRFREYMYSLMQRCSRAGVSLLMTLEIAELFGVTRMSDLGISHLSDNVVLLQYVRRQSEVVRALAVLKSRASSHSRAIRHLDIGSDGMILGDLVEDAAGFG